MNNDKYRILMISDEWHNVDYFAFFPMNDPLFNRLKELEDVDPDVEFH